MTYKPTDTDLEYLSFIKYRHHTALAENGQLVAVDAIEWGTNAATLRLFVHADGRVEAVGATVAGEPLKKHNLGPALESKALFATAIRMLFHAYPDPFGFEYLYHGDTLTDPALRHEPCRAVRNSRGKCIRGRNSNMLVEFETQGRHVVLARFLRKI